ncbi:CoA ester lyase [Dechloromonas sp. ARDL1]|uniref:HpcH/HpaI aldolase/citrate lyase family protein n=1 Tax=Dechloromonas sp. ARDL1 TaxID=3322121 RepID=UPI003DA76623
MDITTLQTLLFVPADRPERYAKALVSGADAIIIDLEDAVATAAKDKARHMLADWLATQPAKCVLVRINAIDTPWFASDLELCRAPAVAGIVLPKVENAQALADIGEFAGKPLMPIIESAAGLAALNALAGSPHVARLLFGKLDLAIDLGLDYPPPPGEDPEENVFLFARSQLVLASRNASLAPPVDGVYTPLDDPDGLIRYARRGARLGFAGMLLIHPRQIDPVRSANTPSPAQIDWATRIVAATESAAGSATTLDGSMVDAPVVTRAQRILQRAGAA